MPKDDKTKFTLVDENGKRYKMKYLSSRKCFGGGWRQFAREQNLMVKDVLVFHYTQPYKFKVIYFHHYEKIDMS